MSILKIFNGSNKTAAWLKNRISYVDDPNERYWHNMQLPREQLVKCYGLSHIDTTYDSFLMVHEAYGYPGKKIFFHWVISFDSGVVSPKDASTISFYINSYWAAFGVQWIQGVHCSTNNIHVHTLANALSPVTGKKIAVRKAELVKFKLHANDVLNSYGLDEIKIYQNKKN